MFRCALMGIFFYYFYTNEFVRSDTDVGQEGEQHFRYAVRINQKIYRQDFHQ